MQFDFISLSYIWINLNKKIQQKTKKKLFIYNRIEFQNNLKEFRSFLLKIF